MPIGYAFRSVSDLIVNVLNVIRKPLHSAGIVIVQMLFFIVPLVYLGSYFFGVRGIFWGIVIANVMSGIIAFFTIRYQLRNPITGKG